MADDDPVAPADEDLEYYESSQMIRVRSDLKKLVSFEPTGDMAQDNKALRELKRGIAQHMPHVLSTATGQLRKSYPAAIKPRAGNILLSVLRSLCDGAAKDIALQATDGFLALDALEDAYDQSDIPALLDALYQIPTTTYPTAILQITRIKELAALLDAAGHHLVDASLLHVLTNVMQTSAYPEVQTLYANYIADPPSTSKVAFQRYLRVASTAERNARDGQHPAPASSILTPPTALLAHTTSLEDAYKLTCSRCTGGGHTEAICPTPEGFKECALCNRNKHTYDTCRQQQNQAKPYVLGAVRIWPRRDSTPARANAPVERQAFCVTADPPGHALYTDHHGHQRFIILDSGCTETTYYADVTRTTTTVPPPLYGAGGTLHRALHQGILYAQTRDGRVELDIAARETPFIPHDLMSVSYLVDERDAQLVFGPSARGGSYIQPRRGSRIPITRRGRQFVLEYNLQPPPPDAQPTTRAKTDLRYPQPSTADQDGPGFRTATWTTCTLVFAVSVGAGPATPSFPGHTAKRAPGLPRDMATLHQMFGHASERRIKKTCNQYGITPDDKTLGPCNACTIANVPKADTTAVSRTPLDHSNIDLWECDLSFQFDHYALDAIHVKSSTLIFIPLKHKSDVVRALPILVARIRDAGGAITHLRTDLGGEFTGRNVKPTLALLGVSLTFVTPELHVNRAEAAHKLANQAMRANLAMAPDLLKFWTCARAHGVAAHNALVTTRHDDVPTRVLTEQLPSIQPLMPWASQIAVLVHPPPTSSECRAVLATYLGPTAKCGLRAIYHTTDNTHVAHSSTYRYLAPPAHRLPPSAYMPTPHPSPVYYALTDPPVARTASPHEPTTSSTSSTSLVLVDPVDADLLQDHDIFYPTVSHAPNASPRSSLTPSVMNQPPHVTTTLSVTQDVLPDARTDVPLPAVPTTAPLFTNDYDSLAHDHDPLTVPAPTAPTTLKAALTGRDCNLWKQMNAFDRHC